MGRESSWGDDSRLFGRSTAAKIGADVLARVPGLPRSRVRPLTRGSHQPQTVKSSPASRPRLEVCHRMQFAQHQPPAACVDFCGAERVKKSRPGFLSAAGEPGQSGPSARGSDERSTASANGQNAPAACAGGHLSKGVWFRKSSSDVRLDRTSRDWHSPCNGRRHLHEFAVT